MKTLRRLANRNSTARSIAFLAENIRELLKPREISVEYTGEAKYFLSAMVRVKNEGRFLPEWISYNQALGVEHFYVYDNGSSDDTVEILEPFVASGLVTLVMWPESPIYPASDKHFYAEFAAQSVWVAFFDPDEFLVEARAGLLIETLRGSSAIPALGINWRYFGSSKHDALPSGPVTSNFLWSDEVVNGHIKTVVQPRRVRRLRNPHNSYYTRGSLARTIMGSRVFASFARIPDRSEPGLVLNHYVYRSREDYTRKATQGFADKKRDGEVPRHVSRIETEFPKHNHVKNAEPALTQQAVQYMRGMKLDPRFWASAAGAEVAD